MKIAHLKANQLRAHLNNSDGAHFSGTWTLCNACAPVYNAVTSRRQRAIDLFRRNPSNLIAARRKDTGALVYIPVDSELTAETIPLYKRNGEPILTQYNREAPYLPAHTTPDNLEKG